MSSRKHVDCIPTAHSHQMVLTQLAMKVAREGKDIVEYGMGFGSTPLLHAIVSYFEDIEFCARKLHSYEHKREWYEPFRGLVGFPYHDLHLIDTFGNMPILPVDIRFIGLFFIDQGEEKSRSAYVKWLSECEEFHGTVICHDVNPEHYKDYGWSDSIFYRFDECKFYDTFWPRTVVLTME